MWTTHGYHIPGTEEESSRPTSVARCGGPKYCKECEAEIKFQLRTAPTSNIKDHYTVQANRVLSDEDILNRFGWHRADEVTAPRHRLIRERFAEMATFLDTVLPPGRAKSVAQTELESAAMWSNKAVAEMAPVVVEG